MSASKHVARATTPRRLPKRPTTTRFDERLQCVIELAADFYWEQDANGRFTVYRPSSEPDAELDGLVGKTSAELFTVGSDDAGWAPYLTALEQRAAFRDVLHSLATAANGVRHFSFSGQPVFDQRNKFKGYRGIARDVSAHIRGERLTRLERCGAEIRGRELPEAGVQRRRAVGAHERLEQQVVQAEGDVEGGVAIPGAFGIEEYRTARAGEDVLRADVAMH